MKRFVLFHGNRYYPVGGFLDDNEDFDELQDAINQAEAIIQDECYYWAHIVDLQTGEIVWKRDING